MQSPFLELIRRFSGPTVDAVLNPATLFFTSPGIEGAIGYLEHKGCRVVFGDPLAAKEDFAPLTRAFLEQGGPALFISSSQRFLDQGAKPLFGGIIEWGDLLSLNPLEKIEEQSGRGACLLRRKVKRASSQGVVVEELIDRNKLIENELENLGQRWLKSRTGMQVHISKLSLFDNCLGKRWFYATHRGKVTGVVVLSRLEAYQSWHLNHLMTERGGPSGTSELLIMRLLETLRKEGCTCVTMGAVVGSIRTEGFGFFTSRAIHWGFKMAKKILPLDERRQFWSKFSPHREPCYLLFSRSRLGYKEVRALIHSLHIRSST